MNPGLPSEDLKLRLLREVASNPRPARPSESKRATWLVGVALAMSLAVYVVFGGMRLTGRPTSLALGTTAGTALIAALTLFAVVGRGRAMVGRASSWLVAIALVSPLALFVWKIFWSVQYEGALDRWPARVGFRCLGLSMALGAFPLAAFLTIRRGTDPVHPGRAGMAIGVGLGLGVATLVDAWCPVAYVPHLLLGHILPLALLGAIGFFVGKKVLAP
jgi:hypothetical protein